MVDLRNYAAKEILADGTEVTIRAIRREDREAIREIFENLDGKSSYPRARDPRIAQELALSRLEGDVLAENHPMLAVARRSGLPMQQTREGGIIHVTLALDAEPSQHALVQE